jgi:hypothetical protein
MISTTDVDLKQKGRIGGYNTALSAWYIPRLVE